MLKPWSNLAKVVYKRTYSRKDNGILENWDKTVERYVEGNVRGLNVPEQEIKDLLIFGKERKAIPAGRGLWFSGSPAQEKLGLAGSCNCWFLDSSDWNNFVLAQDLLMLGGGVGLSIEHRFVSKLPKIKNDVEIIHKATNDADFIIPDSREGWCELTKRTMESFFVTGKSFSYSTVCIRGYGEPIKGFGGVASGPLPLIGFVEKISNIFQNRQGKHLRPIDAMDLICCTGEMVVAGNVRRSAIIILGDPFDKEYLKSKRWDLGNIPTYRAFANLSVICDDVEDLHPSFWKTYENGEPFGLVNRKNIRKYGRMGEEKPDTAMGVNPCGEATLESAEQCNLQELPLMNLESVDEFIKGAKLMHRYGKRVTLQKAHDPRIANVVKKNRRIGTSITGCLGSKLFDPQILDRCYLEIQKENITSSKEYNVSESIRTTVVKPSGTVSKLLDQHGYEGIHPAYSRYIIQRIRFAANDPLIPLLRRAGHYIEPVLRFDGTYDQNTLVVDFYIQSPDGMPVADEDWDTWKQLDVLKIAQKHWADQAVSVTVYYKKEDIQKLKEWLKNNLQYLKSISFLCHSDHGFKQAPKEKISQEQFEKFNKKIRPIELDGPADLSGEELESLECASGVCPIK